MVAATKTSDIQRTDQAFEHAYTPPGWIFWDPELFTREQKELFGTNWLCTGHVSRLKNPGDYYLTNCGNESVILVADKKGRPHAFYNVCRHRGTRIVSKPQGNCNVFKCPYHAWAYATDGKLVATPTMDDVVGFDKGDYPLREIRLEVWNGFVFICLSPDTPPMADVFPDFPDLSYLAIEKLQRVAHHDYDVNANWKLISENYNECYHCPNAHPQLHRVSGDRDFPAYNHAGKHFGGGPMSIREDCNTMTTKGVTNREPLPGFPKSDMNMVFYFCIYPNLYISFTPDYLLTHYLWPTGPESVYIETEWFFAKEQIEKPDFDPSDAIEFWHTTNKQDWALCENALKGLRSSGHRPGRYHSWESHVHLFDRWYVQTMFDN